MNNNNFKSLVQPVFLREDFQGTNKILVIGGSGNQMGIIPSSIEVLKTGLIDKYKFIYENCGRELRDHYYKNDNIL